MLGEAKSGTKDKTENQAETTERRHRQRYSGSA
jgi:hypothetical protein